MDHGSRDESRRILEEYRVPLRATLILKDVNDTFSRSNNHGALQASGEYLFFLNNDIVFHSDPLPRLVKHLNTEGVGLVCPLLLFPPGGGKESKRLPVQHSGIRFYEDQDFLRIRGYNLGAKYGRDEGLETAGVFPAVTGAALLCRRNEFFQAGGFHEEYNYGQEDIDLCLTYLTSLRKVSVLAPDTSLIHEESVTQNREERKPLLDRRKANWDILRDRFGYGLRRALRRDRFSGDGFWSDGSVTVAFAVTEARPDAKAGDYYTALELSTALEQEFGWKTRFLAKNEKWYDLKEVDLLIVMVDGYDLEKVAQAKPGLIKVAWMRNWFDRWTERPSFDHYDIFLASCGEGVRFAANRTGKAVRLFPIATNGDRFHPGKGDVRPVDIAFTGHKWGVVRDIEKFFTPAEFPGTFEVYGNGWKGHEKFGPHWRGFVPYERLPEAYSRARIVIDDAVEGITKPWGSVNSRVFDALAAGALVITNGVKGGEDLFEGRLPAYETGEELGDLLRTYLDNEPKRKEKAAELRETVLGKHTYRRRAHQLREILVGYCERNYRIALKVPAPDRKTAHTWGDYHFALSLKQALVKHGHSVRIDLLPEWDRRETFGDDVVLVLRGLSRYEPKGDHINLLWNISHADKVSFEEYEGYDHVFVASTGYAEELKSRVGTPVTPLLQCTDPGRFYRDRDPAAAAHDILFVGNSRKQSRPIVADALAANLPVAVYGSDWGGIIDGKHVLGKHIENETLRKYYSSCGIVLNDHWPFMREKGFVSNRIFDAGACGACIVSDAAAGLEELFGDAVSVYHTPEELKRIVEGLLASEGERRRKGEKMEALVRSGHGFSDRARIILKVIDELNEGRKDRLPAREEVYGLLGKPAPPPEASAETEPDGRAVEASSQAVHRKA